MSEVKDRGKGPTKRLAEFARTADGIDFVVPADLMEALGWQDDEKIALSFIDGKIICSPANCDDA